MQQRCNLARALTVDPKILIMDEPFAALDAQTREIMQSELLRIWSESGKTVLFITHQINEAIYLADRVIVFGARPGKVKEMIKIDLPRPRDLSIKRDPKFLQVRGSALELDRRRSQKDHAPRSGRPQHQQLRFSTGLDMMRSRFNSQSLILVGCTAFVLYLAGIPLLMLLYGSIRSAPIGEPGATYTIQNYVKAYFDKEFYLLLLNSVYYALGTCSLTFVIGTFLAWVSERTNTPFKKLFVVMSLIPFIIPGILSTISWILLLSPKIGLINIVVKEVLGLEAAPFNVYSMWGMIWAESIHLYPLVFLLMSAAFRNMDTSLEEAALTAGSSTLQTFWKVTLPLMRPAMFSVLLINFIRGIEAFEVPALIGVPAKISVFTTKIFLAIHQFPSDFGLAGAYAVTLLVISTIGVLIYGRITRREERYATVTGKGYRPRVIDLGGWKYAHAGNFVLDIFSGGHHACVRFAVVIVHSLLRRTLQGTDAEDDLRQLSLYH